MTCVVAPDSETLLSLLSATAGMSGGTEGSVGGGMSAVCPFGNVGNAPAVAERCNRNPGAGVVLRIG